MTPREIAEQWIVRYSSGSITDLARAYLSQSARVAELEAALEGMMSAYNDICDNRTLIAYEAARAALDDK